MVGIVFFILILGVVDVGRAVWNYNTLANATREGARYAIVHGAKSVDPSGPGSSHFTSPNQDSEVTEVVRKSATGVDQARLTVESEWVDGTNEVSNRVEVTSRYVYEPLFGFLDALAVNITSSSTMEITH